jgi:ADP-ribose pyrophosphatase YjhB (NUDIX family)
MARSWQRYVGVCLIRNEEVLLQLRDDKPSIRDPGLWVLPGGHVEENESLRSAARREFHEETSVMVTDLTFRCLLLEGSEPVQPASELWFFSGEHVPGTNYRCLEGQALEFIPIAEISVLPTTPYLPGLVAMIASFRCSAK